MVTARVVATIYICPEGLGFGWRRDCENVIGNNVEYAIKLVFATEREAIRYERCEALPANHLNEGSGHVCGSYTERFAYERLFYFTPWGCRLLRHSGQNLYRLRKDEKFHLNINTELGWKAKGGGLKTVCGQRRSESTTQSVHRLILAYLKYRISLEDGIRKWRRDEVRGRCTNIEDPSKVVK
jgi:hypothetical protein